MTSNKFLPPQPPPGIVRRSRLLHLLHAHVGRPLVVMEAPPGYGKTTLAADWASDVDLRVCWLSLDRWDRELRPLLAAAQEALAAASPTLALDLPAFANGAPDAPRRAGRALAAALAAADEFTAVVVDDYHLVDDAPEPRAFIETLLEGRPEGFQVVLLSRTRPSLSGLGRLAGRRQALILGPADLAFTEGEIRELYRNLYREDLSPEEAAALAGTTEGWAAALLLARSGDPAAGFDSLAAEALAALPPRLRRFLLHTSPLPFLTPGLCDAVLGSSNSDRLLRQAADRTLFLAPTDVEASSYRCHQLFRSFLTEQFAGGQPAAFARVCGRAADALRQRGYALEGVSLLLEARAWRRAADVLVEAGDDLIARGYAAPALALLDSLPPESVTPAARLLRGRLLFQVQRVDEALAEFERVTAAGSASIADGVRCEIARGQALSYKGHHAGAEEAFGRALDRTAFLEEGRSSLLRAEALRQLGTTRAMQGRVAEAIPALEEAREIFDSRGRTAEFASTCNTLAYCHGARGDRAAALEAMERVRSAYERLGNRQALSYALNNTGMLYAEIGEFETALDLFHRAHDLARAVGSRRPEAYALGGMADANRALGRLGEAEHGYDEAIGLARFLDDDYLLGSLHQGRLLLYLEKSEPAAARLDLSHAGGQRDVLAARVALAEGDLEAAQRAFEGAAIASETGGLREAAIAWLLAATAAYRRRRRTQALSAINAAADACRKLGHWRFLLPDVRQQRETLAYALGRGAGSDALRRLLQEATSAPAGAGGRAPAETGSVPAAGVEAWALGRSAVQVDGHEVADVEWRSEKAREMFFYLLCSERPRTKEQIFSALWAELPPSKCNSNFHSTLHRLRRALGAGAVVTSGSHYRLDDARVRRFDLRDFREALKRASGARNDPEERLRQLRLALEAYEGPFLPACYSEWAEEVRGSLERAYGRALAETAALEERRGRFGEALDALERLAQLDPYDEQHVLAMMRCQRALGDGAAALVTYRRFAELLRSDLGVGPSPRLSSLADAIAVNPEAAPASRA